MKTSILRFTFIMAMIAASGCASIIKGSKQMVSIDSNVKGADVKVNGVSIGKTPYMGEIKRGSDTALTISKDGFETKTVVMSTSVEPIFWGNILCGGVVGSTTDLATGSMYEYAPATYNVDLVAEGKK